MVGNYTQNAGGTLQLNVAGRAPGQFDVLNVGGNASLNGTLRLLSLDIHNGSNAWTSLNPGGHVDFG